MAQRYNDNTKRPKSKENQLGILKIYEFCQKFQQRASGPGECCWGYVSIHENTSPKKNLPPKSCFKFTYWFMEGHSLSIVVTLLHS